MDRNRFLIEKPQSVVKAEKLVAKKRAAEEKKKQELIAANKELAKKASVKKSIQATAKQIMKNTVTQRITLSSRSQPLRSTYGGCGGRGGC